MVPKILVTSEPNREVLLSELGLSISTTISYEGSEGKVDDLRTFMNFSLNVSYGSASMSLIIWDANRLSPECQAVLLKPLEEASENLNMILVADNENGLLPTVLSRCLITTHTNSALSENVYWRNFLSCVAAGPSKCLSWADELERLEMENALNEIIVKLKLGLENEVNKNRLKVLKLSIDTISKIKFTNINHKLTFGNFLISSWRLIRT